MGSDQQLDPLDALAEEFVARWRAGEQPEIEEFCGRDPERAAEIREFLSAVVVLEEARPPANWGSHPGIPGHPVVHSPPLKQIGDYRLLREVGRGGMGVVYEAEQESLRRRVGLKVLPAWVTVSPQQVQRFHREARAAAGLHHTNIVPVFGVGEENGVHYYVMPFIEGRSLDRVLAELREKEKGLEGGTAGEALRASPGTRSPGTQTSKSHFEFVGQIGLHVAEALDYAASQGVLHRDIKPSNLLLDEQGTVWVTDFGLAKAADGEDLTATGDVLGTLRYLAPERLSGISDLRGDIYSLGITLYELLTLQAAFTGSDRSQIAQRILHAEPQAPRTIDRDIPRDLETVILKAMAKRPADRYLTAAQMAEDLRLFLDGRPITSRRIGAAERLWRWCRRNPLVATLEAAVALLCISAVVILAIANASIQRVADEKSVALEQKSAALQAETKAIAAKDEALELARANELTAERRFYATQMSLAEVALRENEWARVLDALESQRPREVAWQTGMSPPRPDLRGFEWFYLNRQIHRGLHRALRQEPGEIWALAFSPDGETLAVSSGHDAIGGSLQLWSVASGKHLRTLDSGKYVPSSVAFSPDGRHVLAGLSNAGVPVWDVGSGRQVQRLTAPSVVRSAEWSPDGRHVAAACQNGAVQVWDTEEWQERGQLESHGGPVLRMVFSRDGKMLFTAAAWGTEGRMGRAHDLSGSEPRTVRQLPGCFINDVTPEGDKVATHEWGTVQLIDYQSGKEEYSHTVGLGSLATVRLSPDGRRYATAGRDDRMAILWDRETQERLVQGPHKSPVMSIAFDPQGRFWATGSSDGEVKIWHYDLPVEAAEIEHEEPVLHLSAAMDGTLVLGGDFPAEGRDVVSGEAVSLPPVRQAIRISGDGNVLVGTLKEADTATEEIQIWERASGRLRHRFRLPDTGKITDNSLAISSTGRWLATRTGSGPVRVWDLAGEAPRHAWDLAPGDSVDLAFSPDERVLAGGCQFGRVRLWDVATGQALPDVWGYESGNIWCQRVAFSADGKRLAAGTDVGVVRVFEMEPRRLLSTLKGHLGQTLALKWFPDGKTLAVGGVGPIRLWDVEIGQECLALATPDEKIVELELSPDGWTLFSRSSQSKLRVIRSWPRGP